MRKSILTLAALLGGACISSATVTVQGWWHLDSTQPIPDSSGNGRSFGSAYSTAHTAGGSVGAELIANGVGGPLDGTGFISTNCVLWGFGTPTTKAQAAMWAINYNPPAGAYGIEIWALPQDNAIVGGSGGWIFSSGQTGGVALRINGSSGNPSYIDAIVLGSSANIGGQALIDTNHWTHLAIVDNAGVLTFYTNGIPCGDSLTTGASTPAGDVYIGTPSDNQAYYGYLDEARMFTFAPGAFSTNDFLLRPRGPIVIDNPQSQVVWNGGAATFAVTASFDFDPAFRYQWQRGGTSVGGATAPSYYLNTVSPSDTASTFDCILTADSLSRTSSVASLTVVSPNPANVAAYRNAINGESSLLAYFPVDGDTGTTLSNTKDAAHNGGLELGATFDGQTNTSFGARSLSFNANGDVQIPNNAAYEFPSGSGTIEALVYLSEATPGAPVIFTEMYDIGYSDGGYYTLGATADGNNLTYLNNTPTSFSWPIPGGLIGKLSHVALVFDNGTNVTAYWNGQNLGTKVQTSFGAAAGAPAWIGGPGTSATANQLAGNVDELAIYSTALSQSDIQVHYSKFLYGTNTSAPSIVSQPASKTLLAGASPVLSVSAQGTLPLTYQWTSNNVVIPGATSQTLALVNVSATATYALSIQNPYGTTTTQPIVLTVAAPPSGYATTAMADHPTAFWRLSDTSGTTAVDSAGFNDATYSGGFTLGAPAFHGETGTGASFDGSSGRAIAPLTSVLNPAGPFSIEFWAENPRVWTGTAGAGFMVPVGSMDRPGRSGGYEFYLDGNALGYEFHTASGGGYDQIVGDDGIPAPGTWSHVVGVYDGTNIYEYVDGVLGNAPTSGLTGSTADPGFTPNTVKGLYIGSREDNVRFWQGTIADVAFYNYALSGIQISNHYSVSFQHAIVVTQPMGVTNVEGSTISLSTVISGLPNTYQWFKDGSALSSSENFDATAHYPNGVNSATLTIAETLPSDSGLYYAVCSNPVGGATTANAKVLIVADTNPPVVTSVTALGTPNSSGVNPFIIKVAFSGRIDPSSGAQAANYVLSPAVTVSGVYVPASTQAAAFGGDWRTAYLQTAGLTPGTKYTLKISGVKDQAATPNTLATSTTSFQAPVLSAGGLWWDYYYPVTPQAVYSLLQILQNPPYGPQTNATTTIFDTDQITGGDLNNNPAFGSAGDNYGDSLSGWITPSVSGDYYFFLASDDASQLYLSSNSDPVNASLIAEETGCCHGFLEPGNSTAPAVTSSAQTLTAGTPYFIQALHTEGGGGDYVKVAWRLSTDSTVSTNLLAIGASNPKDPSAASYAPVLSSYAAVPGPAFGQISVSNGQLTIHWSSYQNSGILLQTTNLALPLSQWTPVPGNPNPLVVPVNAAPKMFYRLSQ